MIRLLALILFTALPSAAFAQTVAAVPATSPIPAAAPSPSSAPTATPDICSSGLSSVVSRPTQTTAACVVKSNHVLLETGFQTQTVDAGASSYTYTSYPNATIRVGTKLRNVEFDVIPPTALHSLGTGATSDVGAGLRWQIYSAPTIAYGLNVIATAPTGSSAVTNPAGLGSAGLTTYLANANVQGAFNSVFGYGATFEVASYGSLGTRYTSLVPSIDVTASLPSSFGLTLEAFSQSNGEGPGTPAHRWVDAALTKDVGNAQFDLNYGISNRIAPIPGGPTVARHYGGFGVSFLF